MASEQDNLVQQLVASIDYSSRVPANYGIRKALQMLHDVGVTEAPPVSIRSTSDPDFFRRARPIQNAVVKPGDPRIYLNDWTDTFRNATKGRTSALTDLAGILAHEMFHSKTATSDEAPAYAEQLRVLGLLKAPNSLIEGVMRARDVARTR